MGEEGESGERSGERETQKGRYKDTEGPTGVFSEQLYKQGPLGAPKMSKMQIRLSTASHCCKQTTNKRPALAGEIQSTCMLMNV